MSDLLRLTNMTFHACHGLLPEEARLTQRFEVDVELRLDLRAAGERDDPSLTVDYTAVYDLVAQVVKGGRRYGLVEALAEAVAAALGERFDALASARVRVRKPNPPIDGHFDGLEVEIERHFGG